MSRFKKERPYKIVVPVSGGKDSTACLIMALKTDKEVIPLFCDTGWEHDITYQYLDYLEDRFNINIIRLKGYRGGLKLEDVILKEGRFPWAQARFCTGYLKQKATKEWYQQNHSEEAMDYHFWYGMRTWESNNRAKKYKGIEPHELLHPDDIFIGLYGVKLGALVRVRLPIIDWRTEEVFEYLKDNNVRANPLYDNHLHNRVGCYPCMLAKREEQEKCFSTEFGQKQLAKIKILEEKIGRKYEMYDTDQGSCELCKS